MSQAWGYGTNDGPSTWGAKFPAAQGSEQSPINIDTELARYDTGLSEQPLVVRYKAEQAMKLLNTGASVKADCAQESTLTGGPLGEKVYRLAQFHLHWGAHDDRGAEHTVNGKAYAAELHLVHWNTTTYKTFEEAASQKDGLAVLCILIKVNKDQGHPEFEKVSSLLSKASCKGDCCNLGVSFDPTCLLPANTDRFWTYHGSLTTPPCYESVQFILFEEVMEFSQQQMEALRSLHFGDNKSPCMVDNFRPTCKVGGRTVLCSFAH